jgi:hypothetical protein
MHGSAVTDRLVAGALFGALVTIVLVSGFKYLGMVSGYVQNPVMQMAIPVALALTFLFTRPLLLKTVLSARRSPFMLEEDLNAMLVGRGMGIAAGVCIGITLSAELF